MSKHKLLLADDSITIQKVVNLTFADEGIDVISVGDGNSAMEKLPEIQPDLIMADINMPGMNGYEICEKIKQNAETSGIPVILLVGSFEPFDEGEAKRVGADAFLTKPFQSISQLVAKVSELLNADGKKSDAATDKFDKTIEFEKETFEDLGDPVMDDETISEDEAEDYDADSDEAELPVELDETNLLELPSRDYFLETLSKQPLPTSETKQTDETSDSTVDFSPEMIDAIVEKVVEKISDKVIREIANEVVPQMTESIVRQMAEEKLRE